MKQINNKDLLDSLGNYIQVLIITYNGKKNLKLYTRNKPNTVNSYS